MKDNWMRLVVTINMTTLLCHTMASSTTMRFAAAARSTTRRGWSSFVSRRALATTHRTTPAFYFPQVGSSSLSSSSSSSSLYSSTSTVVSSINDVTTKIVGDEQTESFRLQFQHQENQVSPWHDIPYKNDDGTYNMIVEIPKMTKAKMEVSTKEAYNPIAQDIKKGKLRDYHGPLYWNYGCIPQTWEDPNVKHPELQCFGDNDPVDVIEIGTSPLPMGSITSVKPLGVLAMIDDGELDWKVIAIASSDPLYEQYHDMTDVPASVQMGIREWFRWYKTPDDKPLNEFGYEEQYLDAAHAREIIQETHVAWQQLKDGTTSSGKLWIQ